MSDEVKIDGAVAESVPAEKTADTAILEEMAKAGILFGRKRSRTNPKMKKYIYTNRNGLEIFDLVQTIELIEKAKNFLKTAVASGRPILFVGTTPASQAVTKAIAEKFGFPFVAERWLGGTLTNFETISKRLNYYMNLKSDQQTGKLDKYTKKERTAMDKEIERLTRLFGGLEKMTSMPSAVIVAGADAHLIAIREANRMKVPVVSLANTSAGPEMINYVIPANDNALSSIQYIFAKLGEGISEGISNRLTAMAPKVEVKK
jgi:small subunit ribosomal protein S2